MTNDAIVQGGRNQGKTLAFYAAGQRSGVLPTVALSIKQPWAWLILNGFKDIENRDWRRTPPSRVLIHTGKQMDEDAVNALLLGDHPAGALEIDGAIVEAFVAQYPKVEGELGGFVGVCDFTGAVVEESDSPWFVGRYGFQLCNAQPLPFLPWRGKLGFFPAKVMA